LRFVRLDRLVVDVRAVRAVEVGEKHAAIRLQPELRRHIHKRRMHVCKSQVLCIKQAAWHQEDEMDLGVGGRQLGVFWHAQPVRRAELAPCRAANQTRAMLLLGAHTCDAHTQAS
jgi:hypothetical protein